MNLRPAPRKGAALPTELPARNTRGRIRTFDLRRVKATSYHSTTRAQCVQEDLNLCNGRRLSACRSSRAELWTLIAPSGFEPPARAPKARMFGRYTRGLQMRGPGIEPGFRAWKARFLPLEQPRSSGRSSTHFPLPRGRTQTTHRSSLTNSGSISLS